MLDGTINQGKNEKLWIALMKNVFSALNKMLNRMLEKTEPEECREGISCSGQKNMRQLQKNWSNWNNKRHVKKLKNKKSQLIGVSIIEILWQTFCRWSLNIAKNINMQET